VLYEDILVLRKNMLKVSGLMIQEKNIATSMVTTVG
jgi:hypothetical protein